MPMAQNTRNAIFGSDAGRALAKKQRANDLKFIKKTLTKAFVGTGEGRALAKKQISNDARFIKSILTGKKFTPSKR